MALLGFAFHCLVCVLLTCSYPASGRGRGQTTDQERGMSSSERSGEMRNRGTIEGRQKMIAGREGGGRREEREEGKRKCWYEVLQGNSCERDERLGGKRGDN